MSLKALMKIIFEQNKPFFLNFRIVIYVHTDNVPIATKAYINNWDLASKRSLYTMLALSSVGMPQYLFSIASYGEYQPLTDNKTPYSRAKNRRVEVFVEPILTKDND